MWHVWGEGKYIENFGAEPDGWGPLRRARSRNGDVIKMDVKLIK
jgi:hypothetical protein